MLWAMRNNTYIEDVSQLNHAIQCANLALKNNHRKSIVMACLFHDIGHFDVGIKDKIKPMMKNDKYLGVENHEYIGAKILKQNGFCNETCNFVAKHVLAKRYLCTVDKSYYDKLSDQSKNTFHLQGGYLPNNELRHFEESDYYEGSLFVRHYDDLSKESIKMSDDVLYKELKKFKDIFRGRDED